MEFEQPNVSQTTRISAILLIVCPVAALWSQGLPIDQAALEAIGEKPSAQIGTTNLLSLAHIEAAVRGGASNGLSVDFSHVTKLLNDVAIDPTKIYGTVYAGPYPFEAKETRYAYQRFRLSSSIVAGKATIYAGDFFINKYNSERWTDRGQLSVRFVLFAARQGVDLRLGTYDTRVAFKKSGEFFLRVPTLSEGPFVNLVHSDSGGSAVVSFVTQEVSRARVIVTTGAGAQHEFRSKSATLRHEIPISGLTRDGGCTYRVIAGEIETNRFPVKAAPAKGEAGIRFGYFGDTRAGVGGGMSRFMGTNHDTLERLSRIAYSDGAEFLIVGGDLVNGYTGSKEDFEAQLWAWKHAVTSFWNQRPIYAAMGNHEALLRQFGTVKVDSYPYATQSAESVFSDIFVHPRNGPVPSDSRRPTYDENVYSFAYGCVRLIAFNNNYWVSYPADSHGGTPEGFILKDQLDWIERELALAQADPKIRYIVLFAQEPVFPNGGHLADGMWHDGDNRKRAYVYRNGGVIPEDDGMIVMRNRFVRAIAQHRKVAVVLGSDEHAYHRLLIDADVPVGDIEKDDRNRNGKIDLAAGETCSPIPELTHPTWYIVGGGGGAPYYAEEEAPWNLHWKGRAAPAGAASGFYYSSQENVILFDVGEDEISVRVLNPRGELIDKITNLMAVKAPLDE